TEIDTIKSHIAGRGLLLMGVEIINSAGKITYNSIGVNGASFASYKRCKLFYTQLKKLTVDLAIISIGTNDAYTNRFDTTSYRLRYEEMIQELLKINSNVTVVLTVPNDCYYKRKRPNKNTRLQQAIIHGLGRKYRMPVWDLYAIMGGLGSSGRWYKNKLMSRDRVHFTRKGYDLIGDLLWESFFEAIEANKMKNSSGIDRKGESR
ncbi:MAG: GDSL-type esterase/lipase family protein, partial [Sphingobacteriia bacterium]|nr:GDSL-type esterase/lipase family protein [Sphingobacteriia bacterium]